MQHFVLSVILFAYCVTGVELTIRWNRITNVNSVNSVGQYIALVIGIGTTIVFMYNVLREKMVSRQCDRALFAHQFTYILSHEEISCIRLTRSQQKKRRPHENVEQDSDPADENIEMDEQ